MYTAGSLPLSDLFHVFSSSLLALTLKSYHTAAIFERHLPSNFIRQPAQLFADALGLFLVTMHDGILKRCTAEATLRRGDSPTANPKGAQASASVKSLDRLYRVVSRDIAIGSTPPFLLHK